MTAPLVSIVIPCYNHGAYLAQAIESALAQTHPHVEVIVVDDGSTDGTVGVLERFQSDVRALPLPHGGVSAARNAGLEAARGAFVMFLDADDIIAPTKVAEQLAEFSPEIGWVLCDVRIEDDLRRVTENASDRYRYPQRQIGGWIREQLAPANFIPVMAPLVRRSVLADDIRFRDQAPEDWHFWYAVAGRARVRYVPKVLATYRKRRQGRSRSGISDQAPSSGPLILNLGAGTPGTPSWHPMPGAIDLDRSLGWCFEDGLPEFGDATVDGLTISHSLMYVDERDLPRVFREFARVLKPGGVIRITEDDTLHPRSARRGGWKGSEPAVTLTHPFMMVDLLEGAGLRAHLVAGDETRFASRALVQQQHGIPPDVFFIEGTKDRPVLFAPHADDETLFAAFLLIAHQPAVVIAYPSAGDYGDTDTRTEESRRAVAILGAGPVIQWDGTDLEARMRAIDATWHPPTVFAPHTTASHPEHRQIAALAAKVFGDRLVRYHTYVDGEKVRAGTPTHFAPEWLGKKLSALACYRTQIAHPRAHRFFVGDLQEYIEGTP